MEVICRFPSIENIKDFNEDDHPRDENGRFSSTGGVSDGSSGSGKVNQTTRGNLTAQDSKKVNEIIKKDYASCGKQITTEEADEIRVAAANWVTDEGSMQVMAAQNSASRNEYLKETEGMDLDETNSLSYSEAKSMGNKLEEYIDNSPSFDGDIYRGLHFNDAFERDMFFDSLKIGDSVDLRGTTSFTSDIDIATEFEGDTGAILLYTSSKGSKTSSITHISDNEKEVLMSKSVKLKIKEIDEDIIYLEDDI